MKVFKKKHIKEDVVTSARNRIKEVYNRFDHVAVSFSGGKDSTVCLNLTLEIARLRDRLPLDVFFYDEECCTPETIDYMSRISKSKEINLKWLCLPLKHRNACSRRHPYWRPWERRFKKLWVREIPAGDNVFTTLPGMRDFHAPNNMNELLFPKSLGTVGVILGIRTSESMVRYMSCANKAVDNWLSIAMSPKKSKGPSKYIQLASPIYDFVDSDIWIATHKYKWDYNRSYDIMLKCGIGITEQRIAPTFGEEPLKNLHMFRECWPALWDKMSIRVPGAATAGRYAKTEIYGMGRKSIVPKGTSYYDYFKNALSLYSPKEKREIEASVLASINFHNTRTNYAPIPDAKAHHISGISWNFLCSKICRGDLKQRRLSMRSTK